LAAGLDRGLAATRAGVLAGALAAGFAALLAVLAGADLPGRAAEAVEAFDFAGPPLDGTGFDLDADFDVEDFEVDDFEVGDFDVDLGLDAALAMIFKRQQEGTTAGALQHGLASRRKRGPAGRIGSQVQRVQHPEADEADEDQVDRDDKVQKPRHDQDQHAGDQGDNGGNMGTGDDHSLLQNNASYGPAPRIRRGARNLADASLAKPGHRHLVPVPSAAPVQADDTASFATTSRWMVFPDDALVTS
jgi:hypothetical protein